MLHYVILLLLVYANQYIIVVISHRIIQSLILIRMETPPYNNTLDKISNDGLRYTWASYLIFIILSSFIGDSIILIASIKYKAFQLHKIMVVIIQHIAACDIMVSIFIIPRLSSIIANDWILGKFVCDLSAYALYYFLVVSSFLVTTMTASKLLILKYPWRANKMTCKQAHIGCVIVWIFVMAVPVTTFLAGYFGNFQISTLSLVVYTCDFDIMKSTWVLIKPLTVLFSAVFTFVPNAVVIVSTALLIKEAISISRRSHVRTSLKWQGISTTVLVVLVYCISVFPNALYRALESSVPFHQESVFHHGFRRFTKSALCLNTISNFYIYSLTVSSFREFLLRKLKISQQNGTIRTSKTGN